jgi:hypothetical protein
LQGSVVFFLVHKIVNICSYPIIDFIQTD